MKKRNKAIALILTGVLVCAAVVIASILIGKKKSGETQNTDAPVVVNTDTAVFTGAPESDEPVLTDAPTEEPVPTDGPVATDEPVNTDEPVVTEEPVITGPATEEPEVTAEPATGEPAATSGVS